jgi:hypothetical protein
MDEHAIELTDDQHLVSRLDLLFTIRAYNRGEITLEEWLRLSRVWAEAIR